MITEEEKDAIISIATLGLLFENSIKTHQLKMPNSMVIALLRGSFAGLLRDAMDAVQNDNLKTLAKYWILSASGADPVKDKATEEQVVAFNSFKKRVYEILNKEDVIWEDFDKI